MIKTTYECDRCKHVQNDGREMRFISILCEHVAYPNNKAGVHRVLWCRKCMEHFRLIETPSPCPVQKPEPTIEDFIIEIIREQMSQMESDHA